MAVDQEFLQAAAEAGLVGGVGCGDGAQHLFEGGIDGGRGRDLPFFSFYLRQIIDPPLQ